MAIKKASVYAASDGALCATLEEAQRHELALVWLGTLPEGRSDAQKDVDRQQAIEFAHLVQDCSELILDILTTGPRSKLKARKTAGTANPKRAAKAATPAQAAAGFKAARAAVDDSPDCCMAGDHSSV